MQAVRSTPHLPIVDPRALGRIRRLDRCATEDGFFAVAAIDHPISMLSGTGRDRPTSAATVQLKLVLIDALRTHASALLVDPEFSLGEAILTGGLPGSRGVIANVERFRETPSGVERTVDMRAGWRPARIAEAGADGAKFVFFHRLERSDIVESDDERIAALVTEAHAVGLPVVIEPLWYPFEHEDAADSVVARARAVAIVVAACRYDAAGADVLKVQFPGSVDSEAARLDAAATCRDLDDALDRPWVLLSEGVGFEEFAQQVAIAGAAGASGFMVGRSVWAEAAKGGGPDAIAQVRSRMKKLTGILRREGRPWREKVSAANVRETVLEGWWAAPDRAPEPG